MKTVIEKGMQSRFPLCVIGNRIPQEDCFCNRSCSVCHCEPVVLRAANQNSNDCQWQSYLNVAHAGVALSKDSLRSQSVFFVPPWLPLWGSCHEVTERVKFALSASGTSPIGRGKWLSSARCGGHLYVIVLLPQRTQFQSSRRDTTTLPFHHSLCVKTKAGAVRKAPRPLAFSDTIS